jgi:TDG/mug DNA glycosylase family protein
LWHCSGPSVGGIGLTDVVKQQSGGESEIDFKNANPESITDKISRLKPGIFAFNGKRAAQFYWKRREISYGIQPESLGNTRMFVAPSTSGAANGFWNPELWRELATLVKSAK